ncbi:tetratricopeptide repeat protein [Patescibacteria group bacterium]|nr:tetratricopeptide repeat protein [Patescibacteria group bacterium]
MLFPIWFLPFTRDAINGPKVLFVVIWVSSIFITWMLQIAITKMVHIRRTVLDIPIAVLFLFVTISSIWSISPYTSMFGRMNEFVFHIAGILPLCLLAWFIIQEIKTASQWKRMLMFLGGGVGLSMLVFLLGDVGALKTVVEIFSFDYVSLNTLSRLNSVFGIFTVIVGMLSIGTLLHKSKSMVHYIFFGIIGLLTTIVAFFIGFSVVWGMFAFGLGLLLYLGWLLLGRVHTPILTLVFILVVGSLLFAVFGSPQFAKQSLPAEVTMGAGSSWLITKSAIVDDAKHVFIGNGPGTFVHSFSLFRPDMFNTNQLVWSTHFAQPFNTFFALVVELGLVGIFGFVILFLVMIGSILSAWKDEPLVRWRQMGESLLAHPSVVPEVHTLYIDVFVVGIAWFVATVSMAVIFFDMSMWWLWWWLLAMTIAGVGMMTRNTVQVKTIQLSDSPQHSLLISFGMVVLAVLLVIVDVNAVRFYKADMLFTQAIRSSDVSSSIEYIEEALSYRTIESPQYHIALSRGYLGKARLEAEKEDMNEQVVASILAKAVEHAKIATELEGADVEMWDTLSLLYMNARTFAPDANKWAKDALARAQVLEPSNPVFFLRMGSIYEFEGDADKAIESYLEALKHKPDYIPAFMNLAVRYEVEESIDQALEMYRQILNIDEKNTDALYHVGRLFFNQDEFDKAEQAWKSVIQINPNYANALYSLGLLYEEKLGNKAEAKTYYLLLQKLHPDNEDIAQKVNAL